MDLSHKPVLLREVLEALSPQDGKIYVDATFGGGGYTEALCQASRCHVLAIDRDAGVFEAPHVQAIIKNYGVREIVGTFSNVTRMVHDAGHQHVDGIVFDLGFSSMQVDDPARGFSFLREGPLDMRMSTSTDGVKAYDIVKDASLETLTWLFRVYGQEPEARRIARALVRAREISSFKTTTQLAAFIKSVKREILTKKHPATRCFQALRIYVNDELSQLAQALCQMPALLSPLGRLVVVSFHSLEDRIVKSVMRNKPRALVSESRYFPPLEIQKSPFRVLNSPTKASMLEIKDNARARSAILRAACRESDVEDPQWNWEDFMPEGFLEESLAHRKKGQKT